LVHSLVVLVWSDHINSSIHNKFWNDTRLLSINSKRWIISKTSPFCYNFSIPWICAWNYDFKQDVKTNTPALIRAFSTKFWQDFSEQQQYKPQLLSWFFGNPQLSKIIKVMASKSKEEYLWIMQDILTDSIYLQLFARI